MPHYQGSCHCGAMMSSEIIPPERLHIEAREGSLGLYQFGAARHFFCRECGIYPFHQTARKPDHYRVNLGCVEGVDTFALECDLFDGKHLL
ncbi:MAG: GFA family protein [Candidatus Sedimenticola endophacoides]